MVHTCLDLNPHDESSVYRLRIRCLDLFGWIVANRTGQCPISVGSTSASTAIAEYLETFKHGVGRSLVDVQTIVGPTRHLTFYLAYSPRLPADTQLLFTRLIDPFTGIYRTFDTHI